MYRYSKYKGQHLQEDDCPVAERGKKQFLFASQGELRKKFRVTDEATINRMSKDNLRTQFIIPLVAGGHPGAREVSQRGHKHGVKELRKSLLDLFGLNDGDK